MSGSTSFTRRILATYTPLNGALSRWLYRGGRRNALGKLLNRSASWQFSRGILTFGVGVTLEVRGRVSGKAVSLPVVLARHEGHRYLVSMLGEDANWVRNVRAAGGEATIVQGRRRPVRLVEVPVAQRPPILKSYLRQAPGARPHVAVSHTADVAEFERIAADLPTFRVEPREDPAPAHEAP